MDYSNINFLSAFVAALISFFLGALWYSPVLFGKTWQRELGFTDEYLKQGNVTKIFGITFIIILIMAFGLAMIIQGHTDADNTWKSGLIIGLTTGLFFVGTSTGINYLYQRKSFTLWCIDAFYQIVFLSIMGMILGAWH